MNYFQKLQSEIPVAVSHLVLGVIREYNLKHTQGQGYLIFFRKIHIYNLMLMS